MDYTSKDDQVQLENSTAGIKDSDRQLSRWLQNKHVTGKRYQ